MKALVLSDIHGNLEALEAVLSCAPTVDVVWLLGDVVGYGPDPNACIERLRALTPAQWLAGNHDLAAIGRMSDREFNTHARDAVRWTRHTLTEEGRSFLQSLAARADLDGDIFTLAHGSPRHPVWEYILDAGTAADNFHHFATQICLVGHTHVPAVYEEVMDGAQRLTLEADQPLAPGTRRWLVNPGSVGQPRDDDPRASYMIMETDPLRFTLHRVAYDVPAVQAKMVAAGLPTTLASRLAYGW